MHKTLESMLSVPAVGKKVVRGALWLHNCSYRIAGAAARCIEKDGLHPKHRIIGYHEWFVSHVHHDWRVLDVGCGNGALTVAIARKCKEVVGIDKDPRGVAVAIKRHARSNVTYIVGDARETTFEGTFDAVVMSNVLEHIEDRVGLLRRLSNVCSRSGTLAFLLRVPLVNRDWITLYKKELGMEWRLDKTHHTEYTAEQLEQELASVGLLLRERRIRFGELLGVASHN